MSSSPFCQIKGKTLYPALIIITMYASLIAAMFSLLVALPGSTAFKVPSRSMFKKGGRYLTGRERKLLSSISTSKTDVVSNTHLNAYTIESTTGG